jgi:predicted hotdog family 3-hydroxylacyl-ACP dehydratase
VPLTQSLDRGWIEAHIPHRERMCLLDEVMEWSDREARCRATTHRDGAHPLRANGRLGAVCGIEYAAQTMAVHGALMASRQGVSAPPGMLVSVRHVDMQVTRLDDVAEDLIALVTRQHSDARTALYEFSLRAGLRRLISGRAAIAFGMPG